jgi:hypothetical protein
MYDRRVRVCVLDNGDLSEVDGKAEGVKVERAYSVSQLYVLQVSTMGEPASGILRGNHG